MKKFLLTLVLIIPLALVGCKKNDTGANPGGGDDGGQNPPTEEVTLDGYVEPITQFGISIYQLKALETHNLKSEAEDYIAYDGEDIVVAYLYNLDKDFMLESSSAAVDNDYVSELGEFLAEKYDYMYSDDENYAIFYMSHNKDMIVCVLIDLPYSLVHYSPYDNSASEESISVKLSHMKPCSVEPLESCRMAIFEELVASIN